tara:strand:- start:265 stop:453 length:189 start_codon:yes stop_codon:yes gene_type:complete
MLFRGVRAALCPQLHPRAELDVGIVILALAISPFLLTVRIHGEEMRLGRVRVRVRVRVRGYG